MDPYPDSPPYAGFLQGLGNYPIEQNQHDYRMSGTFDFQLEPNAGSLYGIGPENPSALAPSAYHEYTFQGHRPGGPRMLGFGQLPAITSFQPPQVVNPPFSGFSQGTVYGYHVPRPRGFLQFSQNSQPIPPGYRGVCPTPTYPPSVPILIQHDYVDMIMGNGPSYLRAADGYNRPFFLSCDHTMCAPPHNVGFLSRRFEENERWEYIRKAAANSLAYRERGIYSLPVEIIEMILNEFPTDKLTSLGAGEAVLRTWNRYKAYTVLATTCRGLKEMFYSRFCTTKVVPEKDFGAMVRLLKSPEVLDHNRSIVRLITQLPCGYSALLRECLVAFKSLHTLGIIDNGVTEATTLGSVFNQQTDFPEIKTVAIPTSFHPILRRLPGVEEVIFFKRATSCMLVKPVLKSFRGPYRKERLGFVEPVLKSFTLVAAIPEQGFSRALVEKFPRLRKLCLPEPSEADMQHFRGLKELIEFEIFFNPEPVPRRTYNLESIKAKAIAILRKSECHKNCDCYHQCECTTTGECHRCKPPKRFLRIKMCPPAVYRSSVPGPAGESSEETLLEEIRVLPRRIVSRK